jgi:hypothetical protein
VVGDDLTLYFAAMTIIEHSIDHEITPMNESDWLTTTAAPAMLRYLRGESKTYGCVWEDQDWRPERIEYPDWKISTRKRSLFAVACCRRIAGVLGDDRFDALASLYPDGHHGIVEFLTAQGKNPSPAAAIREAIDIAENLADAEAIAQAIAENVWLTKFAETVNRLCRPLRYPSLIEARLKSLWWEVNAIRTSLGFHDDDIMTGAMTCVENATVYLAKATGVKSSALDFDGRKFGLADAVRDIAGNPFRPPRFDAGWTTPAVIELAGAINRTRDFSLLPALSELLEASGCGDDEVLVHCLYAVPHGRGCWVIDGILNKR